MYGLTFPRQRPDVMVQQALMNQLLRRRQVLQQEQQQRMFLVQHGRLLGTDLDSIPPNASYNTSNNLQATATSNRDAGVNASPAQLYPVKNKNTHLLRKALVADHLAPIVQVMLEKLVQEKEAIYLKLLEEEGGKAKAETIVSSVYDSLLKQCNALPPHNLKLIKMGLSSKECLMDLIRSSLGVMTNVRNENDGEEATNNKKARATKKRTKGASTDSTDPDPTDEPTMEDMITNGVTLNLNAMRRYREAMAAQQQQQQQQQGQQLLLQQQEQIQIQQHQQRQRERMILQHQERHRQHQIAQQGQIVQILQQEQQQAQMMLANTGMLDPISRARITQNILERQQIIDAYPLNRWRQQNATNNNNDNNKNDKNNGNKNDKNNDNDSSDNAVTVQMSQTSETPREDFQKIINDIRLASETFAEMARACLPSDKQSNTTVTESNDASKKPASNDAAETARTCLDSTNNGDKHSNTSTVDSMDASKEATSKDAQKSTTEDESPKQPKAKKSKVKKSTKAKKVQSLTLEKKISKSKNGTKAKKTPQSSILETVTDAQKLTRNETPKQSANPEKPAVLVGVKEASEEVSLMDSSVVKGNMIATDISECAPPSDSEETSLTDTFSMTLTPAPTPPLERRPPQPIIKNHKWSVEESNLTTAAKRRLKALAPFNSPGNVNKGECDFDSIMGFIVAKNDGTAGRQRRSKRRRTTPKIMNRQQQQEQPVTSVKRTNARRRKLPSSLLQKTQKYLDISGTFEATVRKNTIPKKKDEPSKISINKSTVGKSRVVKSETKKDDAAQKTESFIEKSIPKATLHKMDASSQGKTTRKQKNISEKSANRPAPRNSEELMNQFSELSKDRSLSSDLKPNDCSSSSDSQPNDHSLFTESKPNVCSLSSDSKPNNGVKKVSPPPDGVIPSYLSGSVKKALKCLAPHNTAGYTTFGDNAYILQNAIFESPGTSRRSRRTRKKEIKYYDDKGHDDET
eukprot:CAMPEP_0116150970 /NCGR_PEP_ID=MMETSP0329-20121206/19842_1 /TAXON_ID=697910 /ORGANISM="Pseudo-nitzschia arenysensis, Strain B593" /LENGTH=973 /DNA_ID=CAMNT_0003647541 /DNA_START=94 /DNA_END=3015 /DNA_ORIENTATION=+